MEQKLYDLELTEAELNLQDLNGLTVTELHRCNVYDLKEINKFTKRINSILKNRRNDQ